MSDETQRPIAFLGQVTLGGVLECQTGLHIGGNRDSLVLSGVEMPVARDPASRLPIVPGSSLKGRMRALLEMLRGKVRFERGSVPDAEGGADSIELLFGSRGARRRSGPTRLIVRDARLLQEGDGKSIQWLDTDGPGTEVKVEAALNRVTAAAQARQVERVIAGSRFGLEMVLSLFDHGADEASLLKDVLIALSLLEDSYLGGHGSRGYGRVRVLLHEDLAIATAKDYESGHRRERTGGALKPLSEIDADAWVAAVKGRLGAS